jgi:hypothetical protein
MEIKMIDLDKPVSKSAITPEAAYASPKTVSPKSKLVLPLSFAVVIGLGVLVGANLKLAGSAGKSSVASGSLSGIQADIPDSGVKVGDIFGSADEKAFNTSATGVLDKGGMNGEGTHKLVRPGGISQTAYLTSSVIDLDSLVGHQVTIWGETFKGQKAGWLMDVGRAKVENLNVPLPK